LKAQRYTKLRGFGVLFWDGGEMCANKLIIKVIGGGCKVKGLRRKAESGKRKAESGKLNA